METTLSFGSLLFGNLSEEYEFFFFGTIIANKFNNGHRF